MVDRLHAAGGRGAEAKKPFYLVHAFAKVHFDNFAGDGYQGRSPAKLPYKDAVVEVDDIVGRLVATLCSTRRRSPYVRKLRLHRIRHDLATRGR